MATGERQPVFSGAIERQGEAVISGAEEERRVLKVGDIVSIWMPPNPHLKADGGEGWVSPHWRVVETDSVLTTVRKNGVLENTLNGVLYNTFETPGLVAFQKTHNEADLERIAQSS